MHPGATGSIRNLLRASGGSPLEVGQDVPVGLSDPLWIEFVDFDVRRQHVLALPGNSTQTCHHVLSVRSAAAPRSVGGEGTSPYSWKWCSARKNVEKPSSLASSISSRIWAYNLSTR